MTENQETLNMDFNNLETRMKVLIEELKTFSPLIDSVQIFCTAYDPEKEEAYHFEEGLGNICTRLGATQVFSKVDHFKDM